MSTIRGPPVRTFALDDLETEINKLPNGKMRDPVLRLNECELKQWIQHKCQQELRDGKQVVVCKPMLRLFRQCQNGMTIETTEWEWIKAADTKIRTPESRNVGV